MINFNELNGIIIDSNVRRSIKKLGVESGIPRLHFHLLRHTVLTNMYNITKDIRQIQKIAEHSDISTTMIYAHISDIDIRAKTNTERYKTVNCHQMRQKQ